MKKTEYTFSNEASVYRVTLDGEPEIKESSILFRGVLNGEVQKIHFFMRLQRMFSCYISRKILLLMLCVEGMNY